MEALWFRWLSGLGLGLGFLFGVFISKVIEVRFEDWVFDGKTEIA